MHENGWRSEPARLIDCHDMPRKESSGRLTVTPSSARGDGGRGERRATSSRYEMWSFWLL